MKRVVALTLRIMMKFSAPRWTLVLILLTFSGIAAEAISVPASGRSLKKVLNRVNAGDTLLLESGTYFGEFIVPPAVTLIAKEQHKAIFNGAGTQNVLTLTYMNTVKGITVKNGRVGIYSSGNSNKIQSCYITKNQHSGISAIIELPLIEDNIITRNGGSGIQLWDTRQGKGVVDHNTIVYNHNHGISIGGKSELDITNNIVAFNKRLTIKVQGTESIIRQINNNYYHNIEINLPLPKGNFSYAPGFNRVDRNDFSLNDTSQCLYDGVGGSCLGSRIYQKNHN